MGPTLLYIQLLYGAPQSLPRDEALRTPAVTRSRIISLDRTRIKPSRQQNKNNQQHSHYPNRPFLGPAIQPSGYFTLREYGSTPTSNWFSALESFSRLCVSSSRNVSHSPFSLSLHLQCARSLCSLSSRRHLPSAPQRSSASLLSRSLRLISFPTFAIGNTAFLYHRGLDPTSGGSHAIY